MGWGHDWDVTAGNGEAGGGREAHVGYWPENSGGGSKEDSGVAARYVLLNT